MFGLRLGGPETKPATKTAKSVVRPSDVATPAPNRGGPLARIGGPVAVRAAVRCGKKTIKILRIKKQFRRFSVFFPNILWYFLEFLGFTLFQIG